MYRVRRIVASARSHIIGLRRVRVGGSGPLPIIIGDGAAEDDGGSSGATPTPDGMEVEGWDPKQAEVLDCSAV